MANTNKPKTEKVDVEITKEDVKEKTITESAPSANPLAATRAVSSLIVHLCEEVKTRRVRDEYKTYESIAALMTSLKKG